MSGQFGHMTLEDLRSMLRDVLYHGPADHDADFIRDLSNEIARRGTPGTC